MQDSNNYPQPLLKGAYHAPPITLPEVGFVRLPQILQVFPVCKSTWWDGVKKGVFPQPVKLSAGVTAWRVEEIRQLITDLSEGA
ncbi:helix-turn-helix transcriptional regulator [Amphritea balenae]|uniref:AlpA family phage regulatory protein n=1 Tax=Amphritea balenae TaxID=452629 RepID=A0A3P1SWB4_9GAMM|nr:AlpA family phage regulatory protein [Amphritea balenae]RRD01328.1 AlpA family phage regulatory protein [Amphritea balenae]GGK58062.1 hypothetical protein GCM10007941_05260 [Amphritea balenae]